MTNMWAGTGRVHNLDDIKTIADAQEAGADIIRSAWAHGFTEENHQDAMRRLLDHVARSATANGYQNGVADTEREARALMREQRDEGYRQAIDDKRET